MLSKIVLAACVSTVIGCDGRDEDEAVKAAKNILQEEVLCSGHSSNNGGGLGWTCIGRRTGREVYCSASGYGRCVLVETGFQAPIPAFPSHPPEAPR